MSGRLALAVILLLTLATTLVSWGSAAGDETRPRYGLGAEWLIYAYRFSFFGLTARVELPRERAAVVFDCRVASEPGGDDLVFSLEGTAVIYLNTAERSCRMCEPASARPAPGFLSGVGGRPYLGLGLGWARWEDRVGWDRGVWHQNYSNIVVGSEFTLAGLTVFLQVALSSSSWFNPAVSAGVSF